ncbi:MAG: hypothetical protein L0099_02705 [Acidobacteria bacterium]|nr:hypothetical protein [Acidobacteriota bacterium]
MGWADRYIEELSLGRAVSFRPRGNSMSGKIGGGQLVEVAPAQNEAIKVGDIVLCKVRGAQYLHLVKAISGERYLIGNNRGRINGWTTRRNLFGRVTKISD